MIFNRAFKIQATRCFRILALAGATGHAQKIPLPEHPRPDFECSQWQNLNGTWAFAFDSLNEG